MYKPENPFENIESAHEYLSLLVEAIRDAQALVAGELSNTSDHEVEQRKRALQLISYNLEKLHNHIKISRRILNDLRTLGRVLTSPSSTSDRSLRDSDSETLPEIKEKAG